MAIEPLGMRNLNPAENKLSSFDEGVDVITNTDMDHAGL
jgi:hypothetical protein